MVCNKYGTMHLSTAIRQDLLSLFAQLLTNLSIGLYACWAIKELMEKKLLRLLKSQQWL